MYKKSWVSPCSVSCQIINEIFQTVPLMLNWLGTNSPNTFLIFQGQVLLIPYLWTGWEKSEKEFELVQSSCFWITGRPRWLVLIAVKSVVNNHFAGVWFKNDLANTFPNSSETKQQTLQSQGKKNVYSFSVSKTKVKMKRQEYNKCWIENKSHGRSLIVTSVCGSPLKNDSLKFFQVQSCTLSSVLLFSHHPQF